MPTLNWIGKEAVVNHDKEVPFKLLKKIKSSSVGDNSQNLIIHGDNLEALKALMPYYVGKIKCVYIDPPYNTGNDEWVYNDKVNSPKIKKWLKKVVNRDDLCKHDKWLCMMYPRLKLLKDLLDDNGVIFISIDSHEDSHLKILCHEIFGYKNIETYVWNLSDFTESSFTKTASNTVRFEHEYIIACYKNENKKLSRYKEYRFIDRDDFGNPDNDPRGDWMSGNISRNGIKTKTGSKYFKITTPTGKEYSRNWTVSKEEFNNLLKDNRIYFSRNGDGVPRLKIFKSEPSFSIQSSIFTGVKTSITGKNQVKELFDGQEVFDFPKPTNLIKRLIEISTNENDIILDSFAGSGTTGHAVLDLNKDNGGDRKFILVEMEDKVAKDITAKRISQAIKKHKYKNDFEYCELTKPLFDEDGQIEKECDFNQFAIYIYFTETQTNIDKSKIDKNFIGEHNEIKYYLIYKEKNNNFLNKTFLRKMKKDGKKKVVYADKCMIDNDLLAEYNIEFKQIPYEVKVY